MSHTAKYILPLAIILFASCNNNQKTQNAESKNTIFPKGEKITNTNFAGTAYLQSLVDADSLHPTSVGCVTFEPGARTKWHTHPAGQIILALDGIGYYQEKGGPKIIVRKGDVVKCPPGTPHWHGASADTPFVQIAITSRQNGPTAWLKAVTDEEYGIQGSDFTELEHGDFLDIGSNAEIAILDIFSCQHTFFQFKIL